MSGSDEKRILLRRFGGNFWLQQILAKMGEIRREFISLEVAPFLFPAIPFVTLRFPTSLLYISSILTARSQQLRKRKKENKFENSNYTSVVEVGEPFEEEKRANPTIPLNF